EPAWTIEHSVDSDASPAFAWSYWTDVANWSDPPATFTLEGPFAPGSRGMTDAPGQPTRHWRIGDVDPGRSATILIPLDGATLAFEWRFEERPGGGTRLTQRISLSGENAAAYLEARSIFEANQVGGMKKMADAMARAEQNR